MAAGEMNPMMTAVCKVLQRTPDAEFKVVAAKVAQHGKLFPIVYGRAKALLGLVKTKPRKDRVAATTKRGPGRPRKGPLAAVASAAERRTRANGSIQPTTTGVDPAQGLTHCVDQVIKQRNELFSALSTIRNTVDDLLQQQADRL